MTNNPQGKLNKSDLKRKYTEFLAGGSLGNLKDYEPIISRGLGSKVWDLKGNKYIDYLLGSGPMLIGHSNSNVISAIKKQLDLGFTFFAGNEQVIFQTTGSAVNELEITNAATGNPPILGASGETNVDLHVKPKGTGKTIIGTGGAAAYLTTSGTYDLVLDTNKGTNSGNITITDGANGNIDITTNGTGAIKFNDLAYIPQQAITSTSNAVAWDAQAKPNAYHVTTENTTFSAPSNAVEGAFICLELNFNGSHTIGWNTVFEFAASTEPTETATDAKTDIHVFRYNGAVWQEVGRTMNLSES